MPNDLWPAARPGAPRLDALPSTEELAFISSGDPWSRARLAVAVERLAAGLAAYGIRPGERVALHLRNGPDIAVAYLACFRLGAIAAPLNLRFKQAELEDALRRLQPRLYLGQRDLYRQVAAIDRSVLPGEARFLVDAADEPTARSWIMLHGVAADAPCPGVADRDAPAVLLLSSGTTGEPKLIAHSLNTLTEAADRGRHLGLRAGQRMAAALPMVHVSGLWTFLAALRLGLQAVLCDAADPHAVLDTVEQYGCDIIVTLPAAASSLIEAQQRRRCDVSSLRIGLTAGDVPPAGLQAAWEATFGCPLHSFWASTEAVGSFTHAGRPGTVSRLVPQTEMRLVDGADADVPDGQPGEMLLRGPHVTLGYWQLPGILTGLADGWYRSGDIMRVDADGDIRFVGRLKDLIVRPESNISPAEVEQVLASHPAVEEAGVAGVGDPVLGQRVMGMVRLRPGVDPGVLPDILAAAAVRLADYKLPERLFLTRALPRNTSGKLDRRRLSAMLEGRLDALLSGSALHPHVIAYGW